MKTIELKGIARTALGKKVTKQVRKDESVPCVLYGNNQENIHFCVTARDLQHIIYTPHTYLVKLDIEGKKFTGVLGEIQFHPVSDKIQHIDFLNVLENRPIVVELPVSTFGNSIGVKQGGKLQLLTRKIKVSALPKHLPENLPIDITNLDLGKAVFVKDLAFDNLTILTPKSSTVCRIKATRASREAANEGAATTTGKKK